MKKIATLFAMIATVALFGDHQTFITNNSSEKVLVEWQTSLSSTTQSTIGRQVVLPKAAKLPASEGVDWFPAHTEAASNAMIYTISVKVYDATGHNLLGENQFHKTISKKQLVGDDVKNNLFIKVGDKFTPTIFIGK